MKMESAKSFEPAKPPSALADLSQKLRHPETWPPDFVFNYLGYDTCAMALACSIGMADKPTSEAMTQAFRLSALEAYQIFEAGWGSVYIGKVEVTAEMVADKIDAVLVRRQVENAGKREPIA